MDPRMTYDVLPPECLLRIIDFLSLPEVTALLQTSRVWYSLISENESAIYHKLATTYAFMDVPVGSLDDAVKRWASPEVAKIQGWKDYCQLQVATKRRWDGNGRAYFSCDVFGSAQEMEVHRIKVDTEKSLLVMTGEAEDRHDLENNHSYLVVHCIRDPKQPALFRLGPISGYAHVEMANGFVVFTCGGSEFLEVWRWAQDQEINPTDARPTEKQLVVYNTAMEAAGFQSGPSHRGELVPMGILEHPARLRASRLVYPTLCVGSHSGTQLWLWDIRTRRMTQTIHLKPCRSPRYNMLYVDVNETHAFVATTGVSVYSRATGQCVFQLEEVHLALLTSCVDPPCNYMLGDRVDAGTFQERVLSGYHDPAPDRVITAFSQFQELVLAVHVSPGGDDFVALTAQGHLVHVRGLKSKASADGGPSRDTRNESQEAPSQDFDVSEVLPCLNVLDNFKISVACINKGLGKLAYDGNRIVAFGNRGLCILHIKHEPDDSYIFEVVFDQSSTLKLHRFPSQAMYRVYPFGNQGDESHVCSCLQVTQDSFWVAWEPKDPDNWFGTLTRRKVVGMMDFAQASTSEL